MSEEEKREYRTSLLATPASTKGPEQIGLKCYRCGGSLERRRFEDTWDEAGNPVDVTMNLYCPRCNIRWIPVSG